MSDRGCVCHCRCCLPVCRVPFVQTASFLFKPEFLAAGGASSALLEPLMRILSLGWSSAAVTNAVQGVSDIFHAFGDTRNPNTAVL